MEGTPKREAVRGDANLLHHAADLVRVRNREGDAVLARWLERVRFSLMQIQKGKPATLLIDPRRHNAMWWAHSIASAIVEGVDNGAH